MIMQEMIQQSYIKHHPTSSYKTATLEMRRVYDGFEVYNYMEKMNPRKPVENDDNKSMGLQQLLGISLHYAPNFFNTIKLQRLDSLQHQGWEEDQVRQHERVLQNTKLLELYIVLPERALDMWTKLGKLPSSYMHNVWKYNTPSMTTSTCISTITQRSYYFTVVHTTDKLRERLQQDVKDKNRESNWYSRKDLDRQFQIKGEQVGREGAWRTITIGLYMEIKMTYRQTLKNIVEDTKEYKQRHFHDYSEITTNIYLN
eukprot:3587932-Amphidinium_carterae.2